MYMIHVLMYCVNVGLWSLHRHWTLNSSLRFEEGLILILIFMLVEIDRRETAAALDQQQQQQNGQTSSSRKSKKSRRWWVRPWLTEQDIWRRKANTTSFRSASCHFTDRQSFVNYLCMPVDLFNEIVDKVTQLIQTQKTNYLQP